MWKLWQSGTSKRPASAVRLGFERLEPRHVLSGTISGVFLDTPTPPHDLSVHAAGVVAEDSDRKSIRVYFDLNNNGLFDGEDPGVPDTLIYIDDNNSGTFDLGDSRVTTDSNGLAEIPSTPGLTFRVYTRLKLAGVSSNLIKPQVASDTYYTPWFAFPEGAQGAADIGLVPYVQLQGQIVTDSNNNLQLDASDRALGGATVRAIPTFDGEVAATSGFRRQYIATTSISDPEGRFLVRYDYMPSLQQTLTTLEAKPELVSGYTWTSRRLPGTHVTYDTVTFNVDLLVHPPHNEQPTPASVQGRIFFDMNGNRVFDDGDFGAPGIDIFANQDGSLLLSDGDVVVQTNQNGQFHLTTLLFAGGGTVGVKTNHVMTARPNDVTYLGGGSDFSHLPAVTQHIYSLHNPVHDSFDIALRPQVFVEGRIFEDINGNSLYDASDRVVSDMEVESTFVTVGGNPLLKPTGRATSDGSGHYRMLGSWILYSTLPRELEVALQLDNREFTWKTLPTDEIRATADGIIFTVDFALQPFQTIHGLLFVDVDADGVSDQVRPVRPPYEIAYPDGASAYYPDFSVEEDPDGSYGDDDVAAATLTVVAAVEDESGNLKIVGLPAEAGLDGSFTLRVPAKDGQRIYVLPNVNATYWKATTQLAGVISLTAAIGRTIEDVHIGLAPRNGVEFAVNIILDSVRDKYPGQGASSLLAYLDQSESAVLQGVPETVPARIATWKASLQQTTLLAETSRGNLNKLRLTTFRSSELQSLGRVRHANAIGPLSLTRDVAKTDSVATRAHLARDPSVAELDAPISNLADESAVFDSEAPSSETREGSTPERRRKKSAEDGAPFDEPFTSSPGVTASNASREVEERSDDKKTHMPVQKPEAASSREGEEQSPAT